MIASLSMYDWPELRAETNAFWAVLAKRFQAAGFDAPVSLLQGQENAAHWLRDDLLFSQTCGYPFATELIGKVHLLGTPHYDVEGCEEAHYSSAILVRRDSGFDSLEDARAGRFAFNGRGSLSGYRCLSLLVGIVENWFSNSMESGGHRTSASMVANGEADVAALDAVCWDMFQRFEPEAAKKLRVLQWTPKLPALPYITSGSFKADELKLLRLAVSEAIDEIKVNGVGKALKLAGYSLLEESEYRPLASL
ncbi:MAG: PhnD/SsuA/transferrin family substrate-binding protein [Rhizobiaceae bacterium]